MAVQCHPLIQYSQFRLFPLLHDKERNLYQANNDLRRRELYLDQRSENVEKKTEIMDSKLKEVESLKKDLGSLKEEQQKMVEKVFKLWLYLRHNKS